MCTLTCFFLPFHCAFLDGLFARELIVSDLHTLDRLCGCPVLRVCVALRQGSVGGVGCSVCRMIPRMVKTKKTSSICSIKMETCTMWRTSFFARLHTMCAVRSRRESTRGRTVQGGLDVPFCFGRTLLVSGLIPEAFMSRTWQCRCCCPSYHDGGKRRTKDKKNAKNER